MLLGNKELAKPLLKASRVINNNPADVPLFGWGQRRLFELYEELIDEVPTARRQLQEHLSDFVILSGDSKFTDAYQKILRPYWEKWRPKNGHLDDDEYLMEQVSGSFI